MHRVRATCVFLEAESTANPGSFCAFHIPLYLCFLAFLHSRACGKPRILLLPSVNILFSAYQLIFVKVTADLQATNVMLRECLFRSTFFSTLPVVGISFNLGWLFLVPPSPQLWFPLLYGVLPWHPRQPLSYLQPGHLLSVSPSRPNWPTPRYNLCAEDFQPSALLTPIPHIRPCTPTSEWLNGGLQFLRKITLLVPPIFPTCPYFLCRNPGSVPTCKEQTNEWLHFQNVTQPRTLSLVPSKRHPIPHQPVISCLDNFSQLQMTIICLPLTLAFCKPFSTPSLYPEFHSASSKFLHTSSLNASKNWEIMSLESACIFNKK